jgi:hypothetical protein
LRLTSGRSGWAAYGRYNLGVAMVQAGLHNGGVELLDEIGRSRARGEELTALRDKANVALAYTFLQNGAPGTANQTQINPTTPNNMIGFTPFVNSAQGLNFSYQGLLTDPMFQAVLHALETSGKSRTLSVPKVTTVNNREATIQNKWLSICGPISGNRKARAAPSNRK